MLFLLGCCRKLSEGSRCRSNVKAVMSVIAEEMAQINKLKSRPIMKSVFQHLQLSEDSGFG